MATATAPATTYTINEFLALPEHDRYELVDGELEEVHVSNLSSAVAIELSTNLNVYCKTHKLGRVFSSASYYQCFPARPGRARKPDVSFIRQDRLPADWRADGYFTITPDLAVEVLSPGDLAYKVQEKIREYINAGIALVWEINPEQRFVMVYRIDGTVTLLTEADTLSGENVVPGFSCAVADLFA